MSVFCEVAKVALLGLLRYTSAIAILLVTITLICETPAQGLTLAASILTWLLSSWGLRQTYDVDDYTGGSYE